MLERGKMDRDLVEFVVIDQLVPKAHLLRKIDAAVDFTQLYEMVEPLYCEDNGRPSIDPVVLFKMVLIQHLYGLPSLRRTAEEVSANNCYRWFLGYPLQEETPHFSTVSYNFRHRFTEETVDRVFAWILDEAAKAGYLSPKAVFIDGTHIKANANTKKQVKEQVPAAARHYAKELMEEVNADREAHGKKPFDDDNDPPASPKKHKDNTSKKKLARRKKQGFRTVTQSTTDPDCSLFVKGEPDRLPSTSPWPSQPVQHGGEPYAAGPPGLPAVEWRAFREPIIRTEYIHNTHYENPPQNNITLYIDDLFVDIHVYCGI